MKVFTKSPTGVWRYWSKAASLYGMDLQASLEQSACTPVPLKMDGFNQSAKLPYGLNVDHFRAAMSDFLGFLGFINGQLHTKQIQRLESFMMPANFSSFVGEFMSATLPKHCNSVVKNKYHNGHPDVLPKGQFPGDAILHVEHGVEIKASRYDSGWQGHNPENVFLVVFVFDSSRPTDETKGIMPMPFRFSKVVGAKLTVDDWVFAGRSETSRRTITASVKPQGARKMEDNWIYRG